MKYEINKNRNNLFRQTNYQAISLSFKYSYPIIRNGQKLSRFKNSMVQQIWFDFFRFENDGNLCHSRRYKEDHSKIYEENGKNDEILGLVALDLGTGLNVIYPIAKGEKSKNYPERKFLNLFLRNLHNQSLEVLHNNDAEQVFNREEFVKVGGNFYSLVPMLLSFEQFELLEGKCGKPAVTSSTAEHNTPTEYFRPKRALDPSPYKECVYLKNTVEIEEIYRNGYGRNVKPNFDRENPLTTPGSRPIVNEDNDSTESNAVTDSQNADEQLDKSSSNRTTIIIVVIIIGILAILIVAFTTKKRKNRSENDNNTNNSPTQQPLNDTKRHDDYQDFKLSKDSVSEKPPSLNKQKSSSPGSVKKVTKKQMSQAEQAYKEEFATSESEDDHVIIGANVGQKQKEHRSVKKVGEKTMLRVRNDLEKEFSDSD